MGPKLEPGRNCWRIEQAGRAAVIVDACDYYHIIRQMMERAEHRILIIGWDFDPRILLDRDDSRESLGDFLLGVAKKKPGVDIRILKWDLGALKLLVRGKALGWLARLAWQKSIKFTLDHAHPAGCSHHQKIVVIDDSFAICGGIDMTGDRWDRSDHNDEEPLRRTSQRQTLRPVARRRPWRSTARSPARSPNSAATAGAAPPARICQSSNRATTSGPTSSTPTSPTPASPSPAPRPPTRNGTTSTRSRRCSSTRSKAPSASSTSRTSISPRPRSPPPSCAGWRSPTRPRSCWSPR